MSAPTYAVGLARPCGECLETALGGPASLTEAVPDDVRKSAWPLSVALALSHRFRNCSVNSAPRKSLIYKPRPF